jgi:2-keto-4-pentenoate hydratase/2-oxohepta-3-ene-1,7-dioic acid hydratase in catechol pathway
MRIVRFSDQAGAVHLGTPEPASAGTDSADQPRRARLLSGRLFDRPAPTDRVADIARLLAPLEPVNILCIGLNYRNHAKETGQELPTHPILFMKATSTLQHPGGPIRLPACCLHGPEVDYEGELAVVIGKAGRDIPEDRALEHVLGYTIGIDVSARRWQKHGGGGQYIRGKGFDTFCPLGPVLVTADEIPDPQKLRLTTTLYGNGRDKAGQVVQDSTTGDMIHSVAQIIAFLSQDTTLLPGTVILTGTPEGVGVARKPPLFLMSGDTVSVEIERIGRLSCPVKAAT